MTRLAKVIISPAFWIVNLGRTSYTRQRGSTSLFSLFSPHQREVKGHARLVTAGLCNPISLAVTGWAFYGHFSIEAEVQWRRKHFHIICNADIVIVLATVAWIQSIASDIYLNSYLLPDIMVTLEDANLHEIGESETEPWTRMPLHTLSNKVSTSR